MPQTMLEFEGCPDEGVLHHVIQESLEERIRAYRLRVADDSQVSSRASHCYIEAAILTQEAHSTFLLKKSNEAHKYQYITILQVH